MGPRGMRHPGMMRERHGARCSTARRPRDTVERTRAMLEGVAHQHGNPRLGTVEEQDDDTVAEILMSTNSLVQRLAIDRATGTFRRID